MRTIAAVGLSVLAGVHAAPAISNQLAPSKAAAPITPAPTFLNVLRKLKEPKTKVMLVQAMQKKLKLVQAKRVKIRNLANSDQKFRATLHEAMLKKAKKDPKMRSRVLKASLLKKAGSDHKIRNRILEARVKHHLRSLKSKKGANKRQLFGDEFEDVDLTGILGEETVASLQDTIDAAGIDLDLAGLLSGEVDPDSIDSTTQALVDSVLDLDSLLGDLEMGDLDVDALLGDLDLDLDLDLGDLDDLDLDLGDLDFGETDLDSLLDGLGDFGEIDLENLDFGDFEGFGGQEVELSVGLDMMCVFENGDTDEMASLFGDAAGDLEALFSDSGAMRQRRSLGKQISSGISQFTSKVLQQFEVEDSPQPRRKVQETGSGDMGSGDDFGSGSGDDAFIEPSPSPSPGFDLVWDIDDFWASLGDDFDFDSIDLGDEFDFEFSDIANDMQLVGEAMEGMMECMCSDGFKEWASDPDNVDLTAVMEGGADPTGFAGMEPLMCTVDSCYGFMSNMWNDMGSMAAELDGDDGKIMAAIETAGGDTASVSAMMECMCTSSALFSAMMATADDDFDLVSAATTVSAVGFCANTQCNKAADVFSPIKEKLYLYELSMAAGSRRMMNANRRKMNVMSSTDACAAVPEPEGTTVTFTVIVDGSDPDAFDKDGYATSMADYLGPSITTDMITVTVTAASRRARARALSGGLEVTASVDTEGVDDAEALAANALMQLQAIADDPEMASAVLGVEVTEIPEDAIGGAAADSMDEYQSTYTPPSEQSNGSSDGLSTGALIGIIAGAAVAVVAIGAIFAKMACSGSKAKVASYPGA